MLQTFLLTCDFFSVEIGKNVTKFIRKCLFWCIVYRYDLLRSKAFVLAYSAYLESPPILIFKGICRCNVCRIPPTWAPHLWSWIDRNILLYLDIQKSNSIENFLINLAKFSIGMHLNVRKNVIVVHVCISPLHTSNDVQFSSHSFKRTQNRQICICIHYRHL